MSYQIENIGEERKTIRKKQMAILEVKKKNWNEKFTKGE